MGFSLDRFYRLNRRAVIWLALLALLWLLRDFFALIFLTFVLAFLSASLVERLQVRAALPYWFRLVVVYVLLLGAVSTFVGVVAPTAVRETVRFVGSLDDLKTTLTRLQSEFVATYPVLAGPARGFMRAALDDEARMRIAEALEREAGRLGFPSVEALRESEALLESDAQALDPGKTRVVQQFFEREERMLVDAIFAKLGEKLRQALPQAADLVYRVTGTLLLALLFSFLVLADRRRLTRQLESLRNSRLQHFYEEAARPVVRFAYIVGKALQAQAIIALINTTLTALGMIVVGVPSLTMLSVVVFVCSFVPVLGVFLSTTPIVLVALNESGVYAGLVMVGLVVVVHALEAYLLNPLIYGSHFKLNPVLVLIILLVGYHSFGVWGVLLGLPVALYLLTDVFGVPLWQEQKGARNGSQTDVADDGEDATETDTVVERAVPGTDERHSG